MLRVLEKKFLEICVKKKWIDRTDKIVIGVSGGSDSVACFHLLQAIQPVIKFELIIAHCNFQLRKTANRDEKFVRKLAKRYDVSIVVQIFQTKNYAKEHALSMETAARDLRYAFFETIAREEHCTKIITAHHSDDNAETILFNLFRGTSIVGLKGIPERRGNILRPFLSFQKKDFVDYLQEKKETFVVDETNAQSDADRNFIRNKIFPLIEKRFEHKAKSSLQRVSENAEELREFVSSYLLHVIKEIDFHQNAIQLSFLEKETIFIQKEIFKHSLKQYGIEVQAIHLEQLVGLISKPNGKKISLSQDLIAERTKTEIIFKQSNQKNLTKFNQ